MIKNYKKPTLLQTLCGCVVLLALGAVSMTTLAQKEEEPPTLPVLAEIESEPRTLEPLTTESIPERERLLQLHETAVQRFISSTLELEAAFKAKNEGTATVSEWLEAMRHNFERRHEHFDSILEIVNLSDNNDKAFLFRALHAISDILAFYDEQLRLLEEERNNAKTTLEETQIRSQYHLIKARQESNIKNFAINQMLITEKIANVMGVDTGIGFKPKPPESNVLPVLPENNAADDATIKIAELQLELAKAEAGRTIEIEYAKAAWTVAIAELDRKKKMNEQTPNTFSVQDILETELRKVQAQKQYEKALYELNVVRPIEAKIKEQELEIAKTRGQRNTPSMSYQIANGFLSDLVATQYDKAYGRGDEIFRSKISREKLRSIAETIQSDFGAFQNWGLLSSLRTEKPPVYLKSGDVIEINFASPPVPKSPYKLRSGDMIELEVAGTPDDAAIRGMFAVSPEGEISLGIDYGKLRVRGLTIEETENGIRELLSKQLARPRVLAILSKIGPHLGIPSKCEIGKDGYITLGTFGRVCVHGLTLSECQEAVQLHLAKQLEECFVEIVPHTVNASIPYTTFLIRENREKGHLVYRMSVNDANQVVGFFIEKSEK